jgi:hypothetical protein
VVIPVAGFIGSWDLAANEAAAFFRLLAAALGRSPGPQREVLGPTYLKQLASPVLWALVFTRLGEPRKAARRRMRPDVSAHGARVTAV